MKVPTISKTGTRVRNSPRLGHGVATVEEKGYDLLENVFPHIDGAMHAVGLLRPIYFAHGDLPGQSFSAIAELDFQQIATEDDGHAVKGVAVPGRGLTWCQTLSPHQIVSAMVQHLLIGRHFHG